MDITKNGSTFSLPIENGAWRPRRTDDYRVDCETGRDIAATLFRLIDTTDNPHFFSTVFEAMIVAGRYEGVEIGFCSVVKGVLFTPPDSSDD